MTNKKNMVSFTPIWLSGDNLGQRHRYLNSLVLEAKANGASIQDFEALLEESPVDRLFKIDLAIKLKHVDYILRNLKDDDMLYVSKALKSTWLLEHRDIINPKYLEDVLFPEMIKPAVTKMKHWLYINLRNQTICQEFYQYYKENAFEFAVKFLSHCSHGFILAEAPKILTNLAPHSLKVLCEICPRVAKIYFESLATDEGVKNCYLSQETSYYNSVKCVLKSDADVFLDITEKYFNMNNFSRFSPLATDYIVRYHKSRFTNKLELYVAYFLHIPTVAARLSVEECQEVVLKLARASYLQRWFEYKAVEPLIKRLRPDKRAAFKKLVFVEKDVGERVTDWPYPAPESPPHSDSDPHIFDDESFSPVCWAERKCCKRIVKKKRGPRGDICIESCGEIKSDLDRLFDEFRFIGFDRALHDLGQRLGAAGSADRRRDIFLVLVSKSGGRSEAVSALLRLATRHSNEPPHTRASILRSLVKRANVWRLPADVWQNFLAFGHGLGLDGGLTEAACREGLHCVVIRQLLAGECEQAVRDAFLNDFSTLTDYSLTVDEREQVANGLQNMLAVAAIDAELAVTAKRLDQMLDVIEIYHIRVDATSPTVEAVRSLALRDAEVARSLLGRLYDARIGRRELLRVNLEFRHDQGALINALRHDPPALELEKVANIIASDRSQLDGFISKLVIYFNQKEDMTTQLRSALKKKIAQLEPETYKQETLAVARPLASLLYKDFEKELSELDATGKESVKLAAALRACAHRARPTVNLAGWGWRKAGVKAVATRAIRCRETERAALTRELAAEPRTVRVALALSMRSAGGLLLDAFESAAKLRPVVAIRVAISFFRHDGATADPRVWDIIKPLFSSVDFTTRNRLCQLLRKIEWIPSVIKADYCGTMYFVFRKTYKSGADFVLRQLCTLIPEVKKDMIENILLCLFEKIDEKEPLLPYPAIFVRYLILSRDQEDLERRYAKIGDRFMEQLESLRCDLHFNRRLDQVIKCLKYNAAFLDTKYMSCLSVIERILTWTQTFMPKEEYFDKYVHFHLTMLFFKAVRQSMKQMPEVFADPKKRKSEGVGAVGFVFGRYIVKEIAELVSTYFDSIIELYTGALIDYLSEYFMFGISRARFLEAFIKGILAEAVGSQRRMAVYVLRDLRYDVNDYLRKEIGELMGQDKCFELLVYAEIF